MVSFSDLGAYWLQVTRSFLNILPIISYFNCPFTYPIFIAHFISSPFNKAASYLESSCREVQFVGVHSLFEKPYCLSCSPSALFFCPLQMMLTLSQSTQISLGYSLLLLTPMSCLLEYQYWNQQFFLLFSNKAGNVRNFLQLCHQPHLFLNHKTASLSPLNSLMISLPNLVFFGIVSLFAKIAFRINAEIKINDPTLSKHDKYSRILQVE